MTKYKTVVTSKYQNVSNKIYARGEILQETLHIHYISFYFLFKIHNIYTKISFSYVLTHGTRLSVEGPKIIFTHMYISIFMYM